MILKLVSFIIISIVEDPISVFEVPKNCDSLTGMETDKLMDIVGGVMSGMNHPLDSADD